MTKGRPLSLASRYYEMIARECDLSATAGGAASVSDREIVDLMMAYLSRRMREVGETDLFSFVRRDMAGTTALSAEDLVWAARWRTCRHVYRIDPTVAEELRGQGADGDLPCDVLRMLPYPVVYVDCPVAVSYAGDGTARGFVAYIDRDAIATKDLQLKIIYLMGSRDRYDHCVTSIALSEGETLEEAMTGVLGRNLELESIADADDALAMMQDVGNLSQAVNMLLYICSREADPEVVYSPPRGTRPGKRTNRETIELVGARMGREIGRARASRDEATGTGGTVSPHVRRAHWHGYWEGKRKGRMDGRFGDSYVLRWIPPVFVGGETEGIETVHEG